MYKLLIFLVLFGCGKKGVNPDRVIYSNYKQDIIAQRISDINKWVLWCGSTAAKDRFEKHPFDGKGCDTGDAALFNGLLCSSGTQKACAGVANAQNKSTGQWFRSEFYKDNSTENSFSKDMAKGVLLYLLTTKDTESAELWLKYIHKTKRLCTDDDDKRCSIVPTTWALFNYVWSKLGLEKTQNMKAGIIGNSVANLMSAKTSPLGYQLHLVGVSLYIKILTGNMQSNDYKAIEVLVKRQPDNPFFLFLSEGSSKKVIDKTLEWCTADAPREREQWSFERDTSQEAYINKMGHDCIFLLQNLLN